MSFSPTTKRLCFHQWEHKNYWTDWSSLKPHLSLFLFHWDENSQSSLLTHVLQPRSNQQSHTIILLDSNFLHCHFLLIGGGTTRSLGLNGDKQASVLPALKDAIKELVLVYSDALLCLFEGKEALAHLFIGHTLIFYQKPSAQSFAWQTPSVHSFCEGNKKRETHMRLWKRPGAAYSPGPGLS